MTEPAAHPITPDSTIGIVGLGYVGLPIAVAFVEAGLTVIGVDASPRRLEELAAGHSPIEDISDARLAACLAAGLSVATPESGRLAECSAIIVCVPTPVTPSKDPDLSPVLSAAETIAATLRPGQLIILQSTTFPGTTNGPFREVIERTGLTAARDFHLAFAPERINPGDPASASANTPRIVGGSTPAATERAVALFARVNAAVVSVATPEHAEMAKLLENIFRNVNIAIVNEVALLCERMGMDVWEIIDAAATKPFGFMRFTPGPGVGGHCIPVDPYYLAWRARQFDVSSRFIEIAADVNMGMPRHVIGLAAEALNDRGRALHGARVGVVGVAFKPNVADARNTPASDIIAGLRARGAEVAYHDPHVPTFRDPQGVVSASVPMEQLVAASDLLIVVTPHAAIDFDDFYRRAGLVVDTVNSSKGRACRERSVLRIGAGWVTPAAA